MKPGVWEAVMRRDGRCILSFLEEGHVCRTIFGDQHPPSDVSRLTIEHVKSELRMGLRAPDDPRWCVALCGAANNRPPTKVQRALFRDYLAKVAA